MILRKTKVFPEIGDKLHRAFGTSYPGLINTETGIKINAFVGPVGIIARGVLYIKKKAVCRIMVLGQTMLVVVNAEGRCIINCILVCNVASYIKFQTGTEEKIFFDFLVNLLSEIKIIRISIKQIYSFY